MTMPRISEEPDVPSEDNFTFQDGRLEPAAVSSQVRHYSNITSATTPIQGFESQVLSHVDPITHKDEKAILQNLPVGGLQQSFGAIPTQYASTSSNIGEPTTLPVGHIVSSQVVSSVPFTGQALPGETYTSQPNLIQGEAITRKDEKAIEEHLPPGGLQPSTITGFQEVPKGSIPVATSLIGGTTTIQNEIIREAIPPTTTTTIPVTTSVIGGTIPPQTEVIRETTTTVINQPQPGLIDPSMGNISELPPVVESQFMRDSSKLVRGGMESPSYNSRWEVQQFELSTMRHESHQAFENWEANRNRFVSDRLNIMNDLLAGMDRTIDWLDVGMSKVILFFKERESQELQYTKSVKHGLTQVGEHFQSGDHPEVLGTFSQGLKESDNFHALEKKNCEILGMFIKKDILDWVLYPGEKNYKEQSHALKTPLHSYKKKLDHLSGKRQKAYNKYFKTYDHIQKTGKPPKSEDSLFKRQLKYSLAAREELRMLRLYNEQGINVIQEFARLNALRMQEVQQCYTMYLQKYRELYQNTAITPEPIQTMLETSGAPQSAPNLFAVKNLLQPANYEFLRTALGMPPDVTYEALTSFLVNFPDSVDPARTSFVLREWEAVKTGGLLKKPKACSVIATTNNNLLIITRKNEDQEIGKVKDPMQLRYTKVEDVTSTEDGTVLKVVERAPGTLFQHTHRAKLKFETPDEANQFVQFVNSQTSGDV